MSDTTGDDGHDGHDEGAESHIDEAEETRILDKARTIARAAAEEVVRTVLGDRGHAGPGEGDGEDDAPADPPEPSSPRQIEAASEDAVRAAVERITAEKEHDEHHKHLKEAERPPLQVSRLTKAIWGDR